MNAQAQPPLWRQLQQVAAVVRAVGGGQSGTAALEAVPATLRPGVQALSFTVWRVLGRAQALRAQLAPRQPAPAVDALLCVSLALLWRRQDAPYDDFTLVSQAVETAKKTPATRAQAGFVNACLRRFLREREALIARTDADPVARWNHPAWWIAKLQADWPQHWQTILAAADHSAPMVLRVNARRTTQAEMLTRLADAGVTARALGACGLVLAQPFAVQGLPGFEAGWVSVQDGAAQRAAPLLVDAMRGKLLRRVLDACAAPGGKTAHLLELCDAEVTAIDLEPARNARTVQTLARLGLSARVMAADAGAPASWWDGQPFDAILLDAPCSASGIVRRHPDIRWLRRASDIAQLAAVQARLLQALWPLLRPGGCLVYATCSVFRDEGERQIAQFIERTPDSLVKSAPGHLLPSGNAPLSPDADNREHDQDGFFYAVLEKRVA